MAESLLATIIHYPLETPVDEKFTSYSLLITYETLFYCSIHSGEFGLCEMKYNKKKIIVRETCRLTSSVVSTLDPLKEFSM